MFEIGFLELALLCVIALLVVGPSRLPGLVRTVGVWVGRAQRLVSQVRADIEREVRADELRKAAKEYSPTAVISDVKKEVEDLANEVSKPVDLDAKKAEPEKSEKAEAAESVPEKPEAGKAEAKVPEAGKPESSDGAAAAVTAPADAVRPGGSGWGWRGRPGAHRTARGRRIGSGDGGECPAGGVRTRAGFGAGRRRDGPRGGARGDRARGNPASRRR